MAKDNEKTLKELQAEAEAAKAAYETAQKAFKQKETEEAERKEAELALKKDKRLKEIDDLEKKLNTLIKNYIKDYGSLSINRESNDDDDDFFNLFPLFNRIFL